MVLDFDVPFLSLCKMEIFSRKLYLGTLLGAGNETKSSKLMPIKKAHRVHTPLPHPTMFLITAQKLVHFSQPNHVLPYWNTESDRIMGGFLLHFHKPSWHFYLLPFKLAYQRNPAHLTCPRNPRLPARPHFPEAEMVIHPQNVPRLYDAPALHLVSGPKGEWYRLSPPLLKKMGKIKWKRG